VVALLSIAPVPARGGWLFEHLLRDPQAPNGSAELLVDTTMRALARDGVRWVTLGLAPLSGAVTLWLRAARRVARPLFNFAGLSAFKRKLRPHGWEAIYLAFPREQHGALAMFDALRAFAGGSLWRFGVASVLRGPPLLLRALSWLLVPWTVALALAPSAQWFPYSAMHGAWLLFDVALLAALVVLGRLRRHAQALRRWQLARAVAVAVSIDAILTPVQALVWNAPRTHALGDVLLLTVACAGPGLAAAVLWGAARRLHTLAA
jgi:phosphatidylglycerol lysyltransferase